MSSLRADIFATIRPWLDRDGFTRQRIDKLDAALDRAGVPRDTEATVADGLRPSRAAEELIKRFEGCAKKRPDGTLEAYPDPGSGGDPWTIGWGSTGSDIRRGTVWTQAQADERFAQHLQEFGKGVARLIDGVATSQNEFDALTSFAYNVGLGALEKSTLLKLHRAGDKIGAAGPFARWTKAGGRELTGLVRRRAAETEMYRGLA